MRSYVTVRFSCDFPMPEAASSHTYWYPHLFSSLMYTTSNRILKSKRVVLIVLMSEQEASVGQTAFGICFFLFIRNEKLLSITQTFAGYDVSITVKSKEESFQIQFDPGLAGMSSQSWITETCACKMNQGWVMLWWIAVSFSFFF